MLDDLDRGSLKMGYAFKDRLQSDAIDELELYRFARYCVADDRFVEAAKLLGRPATTTSIEREWLGPSIYMDLVDCTDGQRSKMHTVYAPTVPRIGETITPESGELMKVIGIDYEIHPFGKSPHNHFRLVPAVLLEPVPDDEPLPPPN